MNYARTTGLFVTHAAGPLVSASGHATTTQMFGAGSVVSLVDHSATFDTLTSNNLVDLDNYKEGGLYLPTGMTSWAEEVNMAAKFFRPRQVN